MIGKDVYEMNLSRSRTRLAQAMNHLLLLIILNISCGYVVHAYMRGIVMMGIMLLSTVMLLFFCVLLRVKENDHDSSIRKFPKMLFDYCVSLLKDNRNAVIVYAAAVLLSSISMLVNKNSLHFYLILWGMMGIGLMTMMVIGRDNVFRSFTNIMVFLAVYSMLTYFVYQISPDMIKKFPLIINKAGGKAHNLFFSVVFPVNPGLVSRNYGLFWEPGAYQSFLNLALIFELFLMDRKHKLLNAILLYVAVQTTFSTAGIIVSNVIVLINLISSIFSKQKGRAKSRNVIIALSLFLVFLSGLTWFYQAPRRYQEAGYGKLIMQFNNIVLPKTHEQQILSTDKSSTEIISVENIKNDEDLKKQVSKAGRFSAFLYPLNAFVSSPIVGVGFDKLTALANDVGYRFNTFTPINWFAENGVLFGLLLSLAFAGIILFTNLSIWIRILLMIPLFATIVTEQYDRSAIFYIFLFSGLAPQRAFLKISEN